MDEELDQKTLTELEGCVGDFANKFAGTDFSRLNPIWAKRAQTFLLFVLCRNENGLHPGDVASKLGVGSSRTAALIKDLESCGLIVCETDPGDSRKKIVRISGKGKELVNDNKNKLDDSIVFITKKVGLDNLRQFFRLFDRILDALEEEQKNLLLTKETTIND